MVLQKKKLFGFMISDSEAGYIRL